jgi:membrane dipeptidase
VRQCKIWENHETPQERASVVRTTSRRKFLRQFIGYSAAGVLGPLCLAPIGQADESRRAGASVGDLSLRRRETLRKARQIHKAALTIDSHVDIFGTYYATEKLDPGVDNPHLRCDLAKMAAGGVDGVFLAVYTGQGRRDAEAYDRIHTHALELLEAIHRVPRQYPDRCELATSPGDVERIVKSGRRAIMIGMENGYPIGTDLSNVEKFYDLGVRYITLSHNGHNQICDSCNPKVELGDEASEHDGLSTFGQQVVAEMNRLGIMVDVSHIASTSLRDVLALSRVPVIASHSGCKAVYDHPRNLDDGELRALAAGGGVIQVVSVPEFLTREADQRQKALEELVKRIDMPGYASRPDLDRATDKQRKAWQAGRKTIDQRYRVATIDDYIDHIDHAVKVAGVDHVGIGSDFDGGGGVPGFENHADSLNVTVALVRRGYSEEAIGKIWGGNFLRVWRDVEKVRE